MTNQTIQTLAVAILTWTGTNYVDIGTAQNQHGALARVRNGYSVTNTEYVITLPDGNEVRHTKTTIGPLVALHRLFPMVDGPELEPSTFWSNTRTPIVYQAHPGFQIYPPHLFSTNIPMVGIGISNVPWQSFAFPGHKIVTNNATATRNITTQKPNKPNK